MEDEIAPIFDSKLRFQRRMHIKYLLELGSDPYSLESFLASHLKMGGAYWTFTALWAMGIRSVKLNETHECDIAAAEKKLTRMNLSDNELDVNESESDPPHSSEEIRDNSETPKYEGNNQVKGDFITSFSEWQEELCQWIWSCKTSTGGFSNGPGQDAHITSTHYAILLLTGMRRLDQSTKEAMSDTVSWIKNMQMPGGGFKDNEWGEIDSRFSYCGIGSLTLLGALTRDIAEREICFVQQLLNFDGAFGWVPGGESHAASVFCCVATLALCEGLWVVDRQKLSQWLAFRQTVGGGFNGRPEKAPDVCYSFWILAALRILGYEDWIDKERLTDFVLESQDPVQGGIADRPEDISDVFHTYFGIAALGLMKTVPGIHEIHPVLALPADIVRDLKLPTCI